MFKSYPPMIDPEIFEGLMKKQQLAVNFGDLLNDDIFHNTEFLKKATNISDFMEGFQNSINILPSIKYLQNTNLLSDAFRQSTINAMNIGTNFKKDFFQNNQFKNFQLLTESIGNFDSVALNIAESIRSFNDMFDINGIPINELNNDEIQEILREKATDIHEETGKATPYNVFSNNFIWQLYLPALGAIDTFEVFDSTPLTPELIIKYFLFTVIPLIYAFATINKEGES